MIVLIEPISNNTGMYVPAYPLPLLEIAGYVGSRLPGVEMRIVSIAADYGLPLTRAGKKTVYERLSKDLVRMRPTGIGISCTAISQAKELMALAEHIRSVLPDTFIFAGGYFPTLYFEEIFSRTHAVDAVVRGEGEYPALSIIRCLESGRNPSDSTIPGVVFRSGEPGSNHVAPARFNLADKAVLRFDFLHRPTTYNLLPYAFSRGCNYRCGFCMERAVRPRRNRAPADIVSEDLNNLARVTSCRNIMVSDAMFQSDDITPLLQRHGFRINFETRCDAMTPEEFDRLAPHCQCIALGFESASFSTLKRMNKVSSRAHYKRYIDNAIALFDVAAAREVPIMVFMIAGYPGDTRADLEENLSFARMLSGRSGKGGLVFKIGECRVYPKTRLREFTRTLQGVVVDDDGVFGDNVVRQASPSVDFKTILANIRDIFSLSHITPKLQESILTMFPFFRLPPEALADRSIPDECYDDRDRNILKISPATLEIFRSTFADLMEKYRASLADQRQNRTLQI